MLAALGRGECVLTGLMPPLCDDTEAMIDGISALGARVCREGDSLRVSPAPISPPCAEPMRVNVRACAAALRMLLPAFLSRGQSVAFEMSQGLYRRPLAAFEPLIGRLGASMTMLPPKDGAPARLMLGGFMPAGGYEIDGGVSSQFASGMLMALMHAADAAGAPARLTVTKPIVSRPYLDMTLRLMDAFGADCVEECEGEFSLRPSRKPSPRKLAVAGDWSQAAALICANALGGGVMLEGIMTDGAHTAQGDARILDVLSRMGLRIVSRGGTLYAVSPSRDALSPIELDCADIPDIAPLIALVCTQARGRSRLTGVGRLKDKECDRLAATAELLAQMGARVEVSDDELTVYGGAPLSGGFTADARGDHRMVMLSAIAALAADAPITVTGIEAISKSWPGFIDLYRQLGGMAD